MATRLAAADITILPLSDTPLLDVVPDVEQVDLIVLGESPHYSAEVIALLESTLLPALQATTSWVYMPEDGHATGMILNAYVGGVLESESVPSWTERFSGDFYSYIRELNRRSPNQIQLSAVDVNHFPWEFRVAVSALGIEDLLDEVGPAVIASQFGGRSGPRLPEQFDDRAHLAMAQVSWSRAEAGHLSDYIGHLRAASEALGASAVDLRERFGERQIAMLDELLHFEALSGEYRMTRRHALRERTMVELARHALEKTQLPGIAHVGAFHGERTHSQFFGNFLDGSRMGEVLARDLRTFHMLFYGLSGERINSFHSRETVQFDNRNIYDDTNLMTLIGSAVSAPSYVLFNGLQAHDRRTFGFYELRPAAHWDVMIAYPVISIRESLR